MDKTTEWVKKANKKMSKCGKYKLKKVKMWE